MSEVLILPEIFKNSRNLASRSPDFFAQNSDRKTLAKSFLDNIGLPTKKNEDWIYTQIQKFMAFRPFEHKTDVVHQIPNYLGTPDIHQLVFVNGILNHALSNLSDGIIVEENANLTALRNSTENFYDAFDALNAFLALRSYQITIPKKVELTKPLAIIHLFDENALNRIVAPHLTFVGETQSKGSVFEIFTSTNREMFQYTTVGVTEIELRDGANFEWIKLSQQAKKATHIAETLTIIKKDANLQLFTIDLGTQMSRENIETTLLSPGATQNHFGAVLLKKEEHGDVFTKTTHAVHHTYSEQVVKNVLAENSHGAFTGKISVLKDAQQISSSQLNNNLLLSKKAHIDTRPQLEVNADDVKCAHGATIGQLSKEEEFYLESRGLSKERARTLLAHGFLFEIIYKIQNDKLKNIVNNLVESELRNVDFNAVNAHN